jgi:hypothetical protein
VEVWVDEDADAEYVTDEEAVSAMGEGGAAVGYGGGDDSGYGGEAFESDEEDDKENVDPLTPTAVEFFGTFEMPLRMKTVG